MSVMRSGKTRTACTRQLLSLVIVHVIVIHVAFNLLYSSRRQLTLNVDNRIKYLFDCRLTWREGENYFVVRHLTSQV